MARLRPTPNEADHEDSPGPQDSRQLRPKTSKRRKLGQINDNALLRPWTQDDRSRKPITKANFRVASASTPAMEITAAPEKRQYALTNLGAKVISSHRIVTLSDDETVSPQLESDEAVLSEYYTPEGSSASASDDEDDSSDSLQSCTLPEALRSRGTTSVHTEDFMANKIVNRNMPTPHRRVLGIPISSSNGPPASRRPPLGSSSPILEVNCSSCDSFGDEFPSPDVDSTGTSPSSPVSHAVSANSPGLVQLLPGTSLRTRSGLGSASLVSPTKKMSQIRKMPQRPSMDHFWDQALVEERNKEHSPPKPVLAGVRKADMKSDPPEKSKKRQSRTLFDREKRALAEKFLQELDDCVTDGQLRDMASSTGGIQIIWTSKLNTTAGRANWRRDTVRSMPDGQHASVVEQRHHASIELAAKVIDDENRLINVIAHEFCHLANFMVSGVTTKPHGREFKAWASKCSQAFSQRGVHVTTKHSYKIDFKYIWGCTTCDIEYKRHSKSIDPKRHRCGSCKGLLAQTKPVPRAQGKPSEYQTFVKEQMKSVRAENPASPQKEILRIVASKWTRAAKARTGTLVDATRHDVDIVASRLADLELSTRADHEQSVGEHLDQDTASSVYGAS